MPESTFFQPGRILQILDRVNTFGNLVYLESPQNAKSRRKGKAMQDMCTQGLREYKKHGNRSLKQRIEQVRSQIPDHQKPQDHDGTGAFETSFNNTVTNMKYQIEYCLNTDVDT